ncbi:MAG: YciE/YciF ferroxidase family protein [Gemmatimonadaceae bacterium]
MKMRSLQDLYSHKLQDLYSAEEQITKALPKMMQSASNEQLKRGFEMHLRQTEQHMQRLDQLFQRLGQKGGEIECEGMRGIIKEGQKAMKEVKDPDTLDAALIAAAQSVEHYEMAGYGTARTWARQLGREQDAQLLQQTLDEEEQTDRRLTEVAEAMVNREAAQGDREVSRSVQSDASSRQKSSAGGKQSPAERPSTNA